ncbi:MAG: hypothetical protein ACT4TC_08095 [Myxococcaceae bacterium]
MDDWRQLEAEGSKRIWDAARRGSDFFMGKGDVYEALRAVTRTLEEAGIPYAVMGAMALNRYGYERFTVDVDVLVTSEGLTRFKELSLGRGYMEKFPGSKGVRDTVHNVSVDFLVAGEYPGDGKPKPVRFPDPALEAQQVDDLRLLPIQRFIELKLASGLTAPHRGKDLVDVQELIKAAQLPQSLADQMNPSVREKYLELWGYAQVFDPISEG